LHFDALKIVKLAIHYDCGCLLFIFTKLKMLKEDLANGYILDMKALKI